MVVVVYKRNLRSVLLAASCSGLSDKITLVCLGSGSLQPPEALEIIIILDYSYVSDKVLS